MKILMAAMLMFSLTVSAQSEKGNGGDKNASSTAGLRIELMETAFKIRKFFQNNKKDLSQRIPDVNGDDLVKVLDSLAIEVTRDDLHDKHDLMASCLNFPESNLIRCNYSALKGIEKDPRAIFVIMFHEVLGLLGIEESTPVNIYDISGYKISSKLAPFVTKTANYDLQISNENNCSVYVSFSGSKVFGEPQKEALDKLKKFLSEKGYSITNRSDAKYFLNANQFDGCAHWNAGSYYSLCYISTFTSTNGRDVTSEDGRIHEKIEVNQKVRWFWQTNASSKLLKHTKKLNIPECR